MGILDLLGGNPLRPNPPHRRVPNLIPVPYAERQHSINVLRARRRKEKAARDARRIQRANKKHAKV